MGIVQSSKKELGKNTMDKKRKWLFYERRCKFRQFYFHKIIERNICHRFLNFDPVMLIYANRFVVNKAKTNQWIAEQIKSGKPFMVARFGNTELSVMTSVLKRRIFGNTNEVQQRFDKWFYRLGELSGFFPAEPELAEKFTDLMLEACKEVDLHAMYHCEMDDYILTEYMPETMLTYLNYIEPWRNEKDPWTAALKGKKVLVIHPFDETIRAQYANRGAIFPGTDILPEFELKTLKAVQTIAGEVDDRFETWFDALEYMYQEAIKIDFDIAIIGCGAYGMPLAAKLKKAGKQAIHLGGVTQILFGIKGRRWLDNPRAQVKFNDAWVYAKASETPKNSRVVENNCYW